MSNRRFSVNGNPILILLYLMILTAFLMEIYLYRKYACRKDCPESSPASVKKWLGFIKIYNQNILFYIDLFFLLLIFISSFLSNTTFDFRFLAFFALLIAIFVILFLTKRTIFNPNGFESNAVNIEIDAVYHVIAAEIFVLAVPAIQTPSLHLMLSGLIFALVLCFLIVIRTIIDPTVLIHHSKKNVKLNAFQLIKGMIVIILCIWVILYLMVYCCWRVNPDFYSSSSGSIGPLDLLYYMFVSFSTIGFGDIVAVRADGLFTSRAVTIIIAVSGFFTTGCFIGAVVSGVSGLSNSAGKEEPDAYHSTEHDHEHYNNNEEKIQN